MVVKTVKQSVFPALVFIASVLIISNSYADPDVISLFPLQNYDQKISNWIKPSDVNYDKRLLSPELQQKRLAIFYDHYYGVLSPWDADQVNQLVGQPYPNDLQSSEQSLISYYSNGGKPTSETGYGENYQPHTQAWIDAITANINLSQLTGLHYQSSNRGIVVDNLHARALPTDDVHFYHYKQAGQGYPFDNLQMSALWVGTPVYIISQTQDHAWMLVMTPDYIGWVKSSGIARVDNKFVNTWSSAAKNKLAAITHTQTSILDKQGNFLVQAYVGAVFPAQDDYTAMHLLIPVADLDRNAVIKHAIIANDNAAIMPLPATPHNFATIMQTLIGRPYGWGSMYFYNDCSAELKSMLTPFGIWLPRHSSDQTSAGKIVDLTAQPKEKRLEYLMQNGLPYLTLIYLGGHVVLYIGNYPDPANASHPIAMTYQDLWGLSPNPANRRSIVGQSVLFPMLLQYPEDTSLVSLADKKYFQVSYLNQFPASDSVENKNVNIKSLTYPDSKQDDR